MAHTVQPLQLIQEFHFRTSQFDFDGRFNALRVYGLGFKHILFQLFVQLEHGCVRGGFILALQHPNMRRGAFLLPGEHQQHNDCQQLCGILLRKTEIDKAIVVRRIAPSEELIRKSINFLRDYLGAMDIPSDEDGLIRFVLSTFETKQNHYQKLLDEFYAKEHYPEKETVTTARDLMKDILSQRKDNVALLKRMVQRQDDLLDSAEDMEGVEMFFKTQWTVFANAKNRLCNGIFNHTLLCEFHQGKLLLHLTISFEEKPKTNLPSDNLKYYRQRKQMTTRQLTEKLDIVPSTIVMYENGKHPIPYDVAIKLADVLEIEVSLLYDDFSRFLAVPYTEALKSVRTALGLSQKAFAERIVIVPSYYYKIEEGNRRPSRKVYQKIYAALETTSLQTSLLGEHPLQ